jgi:hypothetical protein
MKRSCKKFAPGDAEKWAFAAVVSTQTMRRVLAGGPLLGRASVRAYRYLEEHKLLGFIEAPEVKP